MHVFQPPMPNLDLLMRMRQTVSLQSQILEDDNYRAMGSGDFPHMHIKCESLANQLQLPHPQAAPSSPAGICTAA